MRIWTIYLLRDPRDGAVRYVGVTTTTLKQRLRSHLSDARRGREATHKACWIRALLQADVLPMISAVATGHGDGWEDAERKWIARLRAGGCALTNIADGGVGAVVQLHGPRPPRPQHVRDAIGNGNRGKVRSDATRAALSAGQRRRWGSASGRRRCEAAQWAGQRGCCLPVRINLFARSA